MRIMHDTDPVGVAGKVAGSCTVLTTLPLGGKTCEVLNPHLRDEEVIPGGVLDKRGRQAGASMGEQDLRFFREHRNEIPRERWRALLGPLEAQEPGDPGPSVVFLEAPLRGEVPYMDLDGKTSYVSFGRLWRRKRYVLIRLRPT